MNFVAIDFETANFKRSSACSLGLAIVENGRVTKTKSFLFEPIPNYFERINISIHGITPNMVIGKPTFQELWREIMQYFEGQTLIAHNASFDISVLRNVLELYGIEFPHLDYYCSLILSKKAKEGLTNYRLPTLCNHYNIDLSHHDAESDAKACALLTLELCKENHVNTLTELSSVLGFKNGSVFSKGYKKCSITNPKKVLDLEFISETTDVDSEHPFYQKTIVFVGKLALFPRKDAQQIVTKHYGKNKNTLTNETNYLVLANVEFQKYEKGFKSEILTRAEQLIQSGQDLEIISETDFSSIANFENASFEITLSQIEENSQYFLHRNKFNDLANKIVYFSDDLSIKNFNAFQMVGNCSGYGHDYDTDVIELSNYFVISNSTVLLLKTGIKTQCLMDYEQVRNNALRSGLLPNTLLIDENTFLEYMKRRGQTDKSEIKMNVFEWEVTPFKFNKT